MLVDDDLRFEDGRGRAAADDGGEPVVAGAAGQRRAGAELVGELRARASRNGWSSWTEHGVGLFDSRARFKDALGKYAEHRATGPVEQRFAATTWGRHMSVLSVFYRWAIAENYATAEPFTYRTARALFAGHGP